ncbi:MAG: acyl-CoA dehydrogenase [Deltaproteobacteria bacterium]|nr:acyl-CoA dehydrogenase [Deltaproteobacteria bacterium]
MDFELSEAQKELAERIEGLDLPEEPIRACFAALGQAGYLERELGSQEGFGSLAMWEARVALARRMPQLVLAAELDRLVSGLVAERGPETISAALKSGQSIAAAAFSERDRNTLRGELGTLAEPDGDGFRLSGRKDQVSLARACDLLAVLADTPEGSAILLVEPAADGVRIGEPIDTLGFQALGTCPVAFESVAVGRERVIEAPDDPREALRWAEDRAVTAIAVGICKLSLDRARQAADAPRQAGKPPAGYQVVRFQLAEMLTLLQTAELLARRAAAESSDRSLALCAKVFATEAACRLSDSALSILASAGYRRDEPVARALLEARFGTLAGHSSQVARMAIADDALARLAP